MAPRTRRLAAVAAAALVADMQLDSEEDIIDFEEDEPKLVDDSESEDGQGEEDEMDEELLIEDDDPPPTSKVAAPPTKLKITLKLPANNTSSNSVGASTPDDVEMDYAAFKRTPRRRARPKVIHDIDIESEDPTSPSASEEDVSAQGGPSRSTGTPTVTTRPLTTRQAVLASMVDASHVSLNESSRSKKQPLNETELALRREETARKRKNLTEKRLEDEKAETINRLLKKQSRPKNKRTNTTDSPLVPSGAPTPKPKLKAADEGEEGEVEDEEDETTDPAVPPEDIKPTMYRWVSSLRELPGSESEAKEMQMTITFSVPESMYPVLSTPKNEGMMDRIHNLEKMEIDSADPISEKIRLARGRGICALEGCGKPRKYRLPKDWTIGACGSDHLRIVASLT